MAHGPARGGIRCADEHRDAWDLLAASGHAAEFSAGWGDDAVREATAQIDAWDDPTFRRCRAALNRLNPEHAAFVFDKLEPVSGAASVRAVKTFLDRCDALEHAPERAATRQPTTRALATLASRGVTPEERQRLRALVATAENGSVLRERDADKDMTGEFLRLHAWCSDWAETARSVIARRDHLIRLGLTKRKRSTVSTRSDAAQDAHASTDASEAGATRG